MRPWKILHSHYIVRDRWLTLRADRCETASGHIIEPYYVQELPDWVQILAFNSQDQLLLTRQYRHGARSISTEFPCGTVETNEPPTAAAARELLEETGYTARTLQPLSTLSPNPARYSNRLHAFIGTDLEPTQAPHPDETEHIEFEFRPVADVITLIDTGTFSQALHVATFFLALRARGLLSAIP